MPMRANTDSTNITHISTKITVLVQAVGNLWMPHCAVSWRREYTVGHGPFQHDIRSLQDAESRMYTDSGDLSCIRDYQITARIVRRYTRQGVPGVITHWKHVEWKLWSQEDSECEFYDHYATVEEAEQDDDGGRC